LEIASCDVVHATSARSSRKRIALGEARCGVQSRGCSNY
jgi:hypothetical protein